MSDETKPEPQESESPEPIGVKPLSSDELAALLHARPAFLMGEQLQRLYVSLQQAVQLAEVIKPPFKLLLYATSKPRGPGGSIRRATFSSKSQEESCQWPMKMGFLPNGDLTVEIQVPPQTNIVRASFNGVPKQGG